MTTERLDLSAVVFCLFQPYLSREAAAQVHGTGAGLGCLEPQHDGGGEFVVSSATAGLLLLKQHTTSNEIIL